MWRVMCCVPLGKKGTTATPTLCCCRFDGLLCLQCWCITLLFVLSSCNQSTHRSVHWLPLHYGSARHCRLSSSCFGVLPSPFQYVPRDESHAAWQLGLKEHAFCVVVVLAVCCVCCSCVTRSVGVAQLKPITSKWCVACRMAAMAW